MNRHVQVIKAIGLFQTEMK